MLIRGRTFLKLFDLSRTFQAYKTSMSKRRPWGVLPQNALGRYIKKRCHVYLDAATGSVLIGQCTTAGGVDVFCVSHFAPVSQKSGVALLKRLAADYTCPAVLAVTPDLVDMLLRCGFIDTGREVQSIFRGIPTTKSILANFSMFESGLMFFE